MSAELPTYAKSRLTKLAAGLLGVSLDRLPALADQVVVFDQRHADWLSQRGVCPDRCHCIPPGLLPKHNEPEQLATQCKAAHTPPLTKPDDPAGPILLYCGNLDEYQNLALLAQAMPHIWRKRPTCRLVILTNTPQPTVTRWISRAGLDPQRVTGQHLCGPEHLSSALKACDAVVVPRSAWWGFPIKAINALRAGAPLVGLKSSLSSHLTTDMAELCDNHPLSLAESVITALAPRRATALRQAGPRAFAARFDLSTQVPSYKTLLRQYIDKTTQNRLSRE